MDDDDEKTEFLIDIENTMLVEEIIKNIGPAADNLTKLMNANPLLFERLLISRQHSLPHLVAGLLLERERLKQK